ncbi:MAG: HIT domain-containing protein [Desulfuromonadaceae bacterium]|nr:HIT domain-containing protein [Desulfuromonadaceae bacterium]
MSPFSIHPQLRADCHLLGRFPRSHLLLHKNALIPWFILVPETDLTNLFELAPEPRRAVIEESASIARFITEELAFPRINFAAIGNLVPQLHLHLIGRRAGDPCWPLTVWGNLLENLSYPAERIKEWTAMLEKKCGLKPEAQGQDH